MKNTIASLVGAVLAGLAASACCILPAILGTAAAGTLGLGAALAPYRPLLLGLTFLLLAVALYSTYRRSQQACGDADKCCSEEAQRGQTRNRVLLGAVMLFALSMAAYPEIAARHTTACLSHPRPTNAAVVRSAVLKVRGLTCPACAVQLAESLRETPGVYQANVAFAAKRVSVRFDDRRLNKAMLRALIQHLGYQTVQ